MSVHSVLIQKKKDIKEYLDTAWTISIIRGLILFSIIYLIAPYVAIFFETSEAEMIIKIIGLSFLIQGLMNVGIDLSPK